MKKVYRHIGYYNDLEDCELLFDETPDFIVRYMEKGLGHFYQSEGDAETDIETPFDEPDSSMFIKTTDGQYLVRYEKGADKQVCKELADHGWFIDIYKLTEIDTDEINEKVEEYCGHCDEYVCLESELKVQKCPNCGKAIVPCSICPMLDEKNSHLQKCTSCPLGVLCEEINSEEHLGKNLTLMETAYEFNSATLEEREKGIYVTLPKMEENDKVEKLYIHYNPQYGCVVFFDHNAQNTIAVTIRSMTFDRLDLQQAMLKMFCRTRERVYVQKNY